MPNGAVSHAHPTFCIQAVPRRFAASERKIAACDQGFVRSAGNKALCCHVLQDKDRDGAQGVAMLRIISPA